MRIKVIRTKMAMSPDAYSYDVEVPLEDAIDERNVHTRRYGTSYPPGTHYVDFADATASREHADMPQGWDKYEDWRRHEKHARRIALTIAQAVFHILRRIATDTLPLLWIDRSEMPHALNEPSGHATVDTHYCTLCGFIGRGHVHTKAA